MPACFSFAALGLLSVVHLSAGIPPKQISRPAAEETPWECHIIDSTSQGADGVKLADVNRDGLPDVTTGWEEGGLTRAYLNPGPKKAKENWPFVTTGKTPSVEDAVFADLDVLACEESEKEGGLGVLWYENPHTQ
jgi:hypothetical protein